MDDKDLRSLLNDPRYNRVLLEIALNKKVRELSDRPVFNETAFFKHEDEVFKPFRALLREKIKASSLYRLEPRILSIGCSTGEEAYSIAFASLEEGVKPKVYAVDKLANNIYVADELGYYRKDEVKLPDINPHRYMTQDGDFFDVKGDVKNLVTFLQKDIVEEDIIHDEKLGGNFDFIFCMNVLIYFSDETRASVVDKMADALSKEGVIFLEPLQSDAKRDPGLVQEYEKYASFRQNLYSPKFKQIPRENILKKA